MESPGPSFSSENCSQEKFIQSDKISEIVSDSDCRKCNLGLCTGQCFEVYHTKVNYWE
jgi:hypothetical protein